MPLPSVSHETVGSFIHSLRKETKAFGDKGGNIPKLEFTNNEILVKSIEILTQQWKMDVHDSVLFTMGAIFVYKTLEMQDESDQLARDFEA